MSYQKDIEVIHLIFREDTDQKPPTSVTEPSQLPLHPDQVTNNTRPRNEYNLEYHCRCSTVHRYNMLLLTIPVYVSPRPLPAIVH